VTESPRRGRAAGSPLLEQARRFALSLPEAVEVPHHELSSFRVRGKIFATVPPDERHLHVFVDEQRRESVIAADPAACEKLWWGSKVVGVRVVLQGKLRISLGLAVFGMAPQGSKASRPLFPGRPASAQVIVDTNKA